MVFEDAKVHKMSISEFLDVHGKYLDAFLEDENERWKGYGEAWRSYYHITKNAIIWLTYDKKRNPYMALKEFLCQIDYAERNGIDEYVYFDKKIEKLNEELQDKKITKSKKQRVLDAIEQIEKVKSKLNDIFPPYSSRKKAVARKFEDFLIDTHEKAKDGDFAKNYLVLDVETNGLRVASDDMLSLSIFDPSSGMCYNRLLPLDLQPLVLNSNIHGIKDEDLEGLTHIRQDEFDKIIEYFDVEHKIVLIYSGNNEFDKKVLKNYCLRNILRGFEKFNFGNIKHSFPKAFGEMTKDNLCKIFKIDGVTSVHSSLNDVVLEWKLFEFVQDKKIVLLNNRLYDYSPEYVVPITNLLSSESLREYSQINLPRIVGTGELIFQYTISGRGMKEFGTNINGIALEEVITYKLQAKKQDNIEFLVNNIKKLEYYGTLPSHYIEVPVYCTDGVLVSKLEENNSFVEEINNSSKIISKKIDPVVEFIQNNIFNNDDIMSQEMVFSSNNRVLALCDLSSKNSILEIKTKRYIFDHDNLLYDEIAQQLFAQSNNRKTYLLSIGYERMKTNSNIKAVHISIYEITFEKIED